MSKIEIGIIVTVLLALISGATFIGKLDGRLTAIEQDKDYSSLLSQKEKIISEISKVGDKAKVEIDKMVNDGNKKLQSYMSMLSGAIIMIDIRKSCPAGSYQVNNLAIQVSRRAGEGYEKILNMSGHTDWDISENYDGRQFKTCVFK